MCGTEYVLPYLRFVESLVGVACYEFENCGAAAAGSSLLPVKRKGSSVHHSVLVSQSITLNVLFFVHWWVVQYDVCSVSLMADAVTC